MSRPKSRYITSSLESNHELVLKFVMACKGSGLKFVEVRHSLLREMRHFRNMSKYGFDHIFLAEHGEKPDKVDLCEESVREALSNYLWKVEVTLALIKEVIEIFIAENR